MQMKSVIIAVAAFAAGAAAGWFAAGVGKERPCNETTAAPVVKPRASGVGRQTSASIPTARAQSRRTAAESQRKAPSEQAGEKPKDVTGENSVDKGADNDNPFPRYLDMFKNNPAALAAEFEKEAAADRAAQRKLRDKIIEKLKLNDEQTVMFEKTLDGLRDEITQQNREWVELITSGQLNDDTAAEGRIWDSNPLLGQRMVAAREAAVRETAEKLYEQLALDGVSDAEEQNALIWVVQNTAFSYECLEPNLAVYDKLYKNMGVGKGIFSWCTRQRQSKNK